MVHLQVWHLPLTESFYLQKYRLWYCGVPHSILISSIFNLSQDQGLNWFNLILDSVSWFRMNWTSSFSLYFDPTEQHVFCIFFNYKGYHRKMLQFIMPPKSIYNKMPWFHRTKKFTFEQYKEFQTVKNLLIDNIFSHENVSDDLFRAVPCSLMLVLNKDGLFHCRKVYKKH